MLPDRPQTRPDSFVQGPRPLNIAGFAAFLNLASKAEKYALTSTPLPGQASPNNPLFQGNDGDEIEAQNKKSNQFF